MHTCNIDQPQTLELSRYTGLRPRKIKLELSYLIRYTKNIKLYMSILHTKNSCNKNHAKIDDFIATSGLINRPTLGDFDDMGNQFTL